MNLEQDDPRLSAWVLGELSSEEASQMEALVAADPSLLRSAEEIRNLGSYLTGHLAPVELRPAQRQTVYHSIRAPLPPVVTLTFAPPSRKKQGAWSTALTAAAMIALGAVAFVQGRLPSGQRGGAAVADARHRDAADGLERTTISTSKSTPSPDYDHLNVAGGLPERAAPDAAALSQNLEQESLPESWKLSSEPSLTSSQPVAEVALPLVVGRASYDRVRGWIRDRNQLPPKEAVRIEELANAFPLPSQEETVVFAGLRVACITMNSPWVAGARLVGVQIANESRDSRSVAWSFRPGHPAKGLRILASTDGDGKGSSVLPPGQRTLVLLELAAPDSDVGDLVVNSEGRSRRFPAMETKDGGMTQAGLVAAFGLWLRGEGIDDSRLTQMLASAGDDPDPGRADSRCLIRQALNLAEAKRSKR